MKHYGVVAFAFGLPETITSNVEISQCATGASDRLAAPIFTQYGVAIPADRYPVTYMHEDAPGSPTLRIARAAIDWALERGITTIIVVCATPHAKRCMRDMNLAVQERKLSITVVLDVCAEALPQSTWFCPDSTQPRTRSASAWWKREALLLHMPTFVYTRIAS